MFVCLDIMRPSSLSDCHSCLGGEIGRRSGFKIHRWQQHVGSSPTPGTKFFLRFPSQGFVTTRTHSGSLSMSKKNQTRQSKPPASRTPSIKPNGTHSSPAALSLANCEPAGLFRRLAAAVYDFLILAAIWLLMGFFFLAVVLGGKPAEDPTILQVGLFPLLVLATLGFYSWFWMHGGQTLGMRAWKLKVVHARLDGTPISFAQCLLRCLMGIFSWGVFGLGYLWVLTDPSRDTWHDRVSGTRTLVIPKALM